MRLCCIFTSFWQLLVLFSVFQTISTDDDDDDDDNKQQQQQQQPNAAAKFVMRTDNGDEFANPNGCSGVCPPESSLVFQGGCACKCRPSWTWRQDVGKCVLESGCEFSVVTNSHVPTMLFDTTVNQYLKPDHVVMKNGKTVLSTVNYHIPSFRLMRFDDNSWTFPPLNLWFDFYFSTKNVQYEAIKSRASNDDLHEYYDSLVNFTVSRGLQRQGCLLVKFARPVTSNGTTNFSVVPPSSVQGIAGTAAIGKPTSSASASALSSSTTPVPTTRVSTTASSLVTSYRSSLHHTAFPTQPRASALAGTNGSVHLGRTTDVPTETGTGSATVSGKVRVSMTVTSSRSVSTIANQPTTPSKSGTVWYRDSRLQTSFPSVTPSVPSITSHSTSSGKEDVTLPALTYDIATTSVTSQTSRNVDFSDTTTGTDSLSTSSTVFEAGQRTKDLPDGNFYPSSMPVHTMTARPPVTDSVTGWTTADVTPSENKGRSVDKDNGIDVILLACSVASAVAFLLLLVTVIVVVCRKTACIKRKGRIQDGNGGHVITNSMQRLAPSSRPNPMSANNISGPCYNSLPLHRPLLLQTSIATVDETTFARLDGFKTVDYASAPVYEEPVIPPRLASEESSLAYESLDMLRFQPRGYECPQTVYTNSNAVAAQL